jgi:hypothetical protein
MGDLPPDLDRLGHALTHAAERAVTRRRQRNDRRRRLCACVLAGLLVFAAMTPSHLGRADQADIFSFAIEPAGAAEVCVQLRGLRFKDNDACIERHRAPHGAR